MASLNNLIKNNDIAGIISFMKVNDLKLENNKIVPNSLESKVAISKTRDFYDQRQLIKKILLNS